jgi:hypothetical protein
MWDSLSQESYLAIITLGARVKRQRHTRESGLEQDTVRCGMSLRQLDEIAENAFGRGIDNTGRIPNFTGFVN